MKNTLILFFLFIVQIAYSQNIPQTLLGQWRPLEYQNLKTGEITDNPNIEESTLLVEFLSDGIFRANACNGIDCKYSVSEKYVYFQNFKARTRTGCSRWEGLIEKSFNNQKQLEYGFKGLLLQLSLKNESVLTLERVSF